jgi:hypothetical protein
MKKLMEELMTEEKAEAAKEQDSWTKTAITLPLKIGGTLLSRVVLPYFLGDRRRKRRDVTDNAFKVFFLDILFGFKIKINISLFIYRILWKAQ